MNNKVFDTINKIYSKAGFLEKYGGSLWLTVIFIIIFTIIYVYYAIYNIYNNKNVKACMFLFYQSFICITY